MVIVLGSTETVTLKMRLFAFVLFFILCSFYGSSQQTSVEYKIGMILPDSGFRVAMKIKNIESPFHIALVAHPEYDDHYWKYIDSLTIGDADGSALITREDSALWKISSGKSEIVINYRIVLPSAEKWRAAWKPFLSPNGTLTGDYHCLFYIPGKEHISSTVTLMLPPQWIVATELEPTGNNSFIAHSVNELADAPILAGILDTMTFSVSNVKHTIAYYPHGAESFDRKIFVNEVEQIVKQTERVFKNLPYKNYHFLLQDSAFGALEHRNSITIGAPANELANDRSNILEELAHEYFHSWNLVRIRPAEYGDVVYKNPPLPATLWFSEGFTMYYADLLLRRAKIKTADSTRLIHLERLLEEYWSNAANYEVSPERVSIASNATPGMLGNYSAGPHLQGELLATIFDLMIINNSSGKRSLDDVMRMMMKQYGKKGFTGKDLEKVLSAAAGFSVTNFFNAHIRNSEPPDFNRYFAMAGFSAEKKYIKALDHSGKPMPDVRIYAWQNGRYFRFGTSNPHGCWVRSGLRTGDTLISLNGKKFNSQQEFFRTARTIKYGDTVTVIIMRNNKPEEKKVIVGGFQTATVKLKNKKQLSAKQKQTRELWLNRNY
jgi:predicted metalloprotease with PDZ domain